MVACVDGHALYPNLASTQNAFDAESLSTAVGSPAVPATTRSVRDDSRLDQEGCPCRRDGPAADPAQAPGIGRTYALVSGGPLTADNPYWDVQPVPHTGYSDMWFGAPD